MHKYRRPLIAIAAVTAMATLLSACIVVPRGHYRHHRHYGSVAPDATVPAAPTAPVAG